MAWHQGRDISSKTSFKLLMLFCVVLLLLPFPKWFTDLPARGLWLLLEPISSGGRYFAQRIGNDSTSLASETVSAQRHRQAEIEIYNLRQQLRHARDLNAQLSDLDQQFGLAPVRLIPAQVAGSDSASWRDILLLNRSGLQPGQIALSGTGLTGPQNPRTDNWNESLYQMCVVGHIKDDRTDTFKLQLLTDADFSLPVFIEPRWDRAENWRANGHLNGQGMGQIEVILVKTDFPVRIGDAVLACSDSEKLPVEILIGFVKSCRRHPNNPIFWQITAEPALPLESLRHVIILDTQWKSSVRN
ncbi:MAG: hypothetical protein AMJ79_03610 [Phycisphaerae bacterium SM23_30]|nr:MAG: hypothetical protein AMJ79_03610 [Phycisphaerae bacterium SM23_30]